MEPQPLSSNDLGKLLVFSIITLGACFLVGWGVIPAFVLLFGVFMSKKTRNFGHVKTAVNISRIYFISVPLIGFLFLKCSELQFDTRYYNQMSESAETGLFLSAISLCYWLLLEFLFYQPLLKARDFIEFKGRLLEGARSKNNIKMQDFSIDEYEPTFNTKELKVWIEFKEQGYITESEYESAKSKIFGCE